MRKKNGRSSPQWYRVPGTDFYKTRVSDGEPYIKSTEIAKKNDVAPPNLCNLDHKGACVYPGLSVPRDAWNQA